MNINLLKKYILKNSSLTLFTEDDNYLYLSTNALLVKLKQENIDKDFIYFINKLLKKYDLEFIIKNNMVVTTQTIYYLDNFQKALSKERTRKINLNNFIKTEEVPSIVSKMTIEDIESIDALYFDLSDIYINYILTPEDILEEILMSRIKIFIPDIKYENAFSKSVIDLVPIESIETIGIRDNDLLELKTKEGEYIFTYPIKYLDE